MGSIKSGLGNSVSLVAVFGVWRRQHNILLCMKIKHLWMYQPQYYNAPLFGSLGSSTGLSPLLATTAMAQLNCLNEFAAEIKMAALFPALKRSSDKFIKIHWKPFFPYSIISS